MSSLTFCNWDWRPAVLLRPEYKAFAVLDRVSLKQALRKGNPVGHFLPIEELTRRTRAARAGRA